MHRDPEYMVDILDAARAIKTYVAEKTEESFLKDPLCQDAVIRRLEIIGEAARRVSEETRKSLPEVPWNDMTGMRNRLIHRYDDIDMAILWDTICSNISPLIISLEKIIQLEE